LDYVLEGFICFLDGEAVVWADIVSCCEGNKEGESFEGVVLGGPDGMY
jgi:hypothetical protein